MALRLSLKLFFGVSPAPGGGFNGVKINRLVFE